MFCDITGYKFIIILYYTDHSRDARSDVGCGISSSYTDTSLPWDIRSVNRNVLNHKSHSLQNMIV